MRVVRFRYTDSLVFKVGSRYTDGFVIKVLSDLDILTVWSFITICHCVLTMTNKHLVKHTVNSPTISIVDPLKFHAFQGTISKYLEAFMAY